MYALTIATSLRTMVGVSNWYAKSKNFFARTWHVLWKFIYMEMIRLPQGGGKSGHSNVFIWR